MPARLRLGLGEAVRPVAARAARRPRRSSAPLGLDVQLLPGRSSRVSTCQVGASVGGGRSGASWPSRSSSARVGRVHARGVERDARAGLAAEQRLGVVRSSRSPRSRRSARRTSTRRGPSGPSSPRRTRTRASSSGVALRIARWSGVPQSRVDGVDVGDDHAARRRRSRSPAARSRGPCRSRPPRRAAGGPAGAGSSA